MLLALGFGAANALVLSQVAKQRPPVAAAAPTSAAATAGQTSPQALAGAPPEPPDTHLYDVVITGGRVIDPETRFDRIADVGIDGPTIVAITDKKLNGRMTIDAKDRVVAPGFIDLISYDPNPYGIWYKIADGVTTNLGMHGMLDDRRAVLRHLRAAGFAVPLRRFVRQLLHARRGALRHRIE